MDHRAQDCKESDMTEHLTLTLTQVRQPCLCLVAQSCPTVCDPMDCSPWNSPGKNTGVHSLSLLQGIFPTQGSNPGLPHCRRILYQLSCQGSPLPKPLTKVLLCITPGGLNPQEREKEPIISSKHSRKTNPGNFTSLGNPVTYCPP